MDITSFVEVSGALDRLRTISDIKPIDANADLHAEAGHDSAAALLDGLLKPLSDHPTVTMALVAALVIFLLLRFGGGGGRSQPVTAVAKSSDPTQDVHEDEQQPTTQNVATDTSSGPEMVPDALTAHSLKIALDGNVASDDTNVGTEPVARAEETASSVPEDNAFKGDIAPSVITQEVTI